MQFGAIIPRIDSHLDKISQAVPETYNGGSGYWDGMSRPVREGGFASDLYRLTRLLSRTLFARSRTLVRCVSSKRSGSMPREYLIQHRFLAQHEEALITDQDLKSYPTTAEAAGLDAMSSFQRVLEHSIDIQVRSVCSSGRTKSKGSSIARSLDHLLYTF